jgi:hypothetical protein
MGLKSLVLHIAVVVSLSLISLDALLPQYSIPSKLPFLSHSANHPNDGNEAQPRYLQQLAVTPRGV